MTRLSRVESQAVTRERLLATARELFQKQSYATTSVERIAEAAGYSKGAVYSNFESKEAIFLAVLEAQAQESLNELLARIKRTTGATAVVELMADCDVRSRPPLPLHDAHRLRPTRPRRGDPAGAGRMASEDA